MKNRIFSSVGDGRYSDLISEQIKKAILKGDFRPGDKLPSEKEMIEQFGVSRVPLREALRILEHAGFITIKQGVSGGAFISDLDFKSVFEGLDSLFILSKIDFREIYETRLLLEPAVARLASQRATDNDLIKLREIDGQRKKVMKSANKDSFMVHIDFHQYLAKITQNYMLQILLDSFSSLISKHIDRLPLTKEKLKKASWFHEKILNAMEQKRHEEVYQIMEEHLKYNMEAFSLYF